MTGRIYERIEVWLREEFPDESDEEIQRLAELIFQAWLDGVI